MCIRPAAITLLLRKSYLCKQKQLVSSVLATADSSRKRSSGDAVASLQPLGKKARILSKAAVGTTKGPSAATASNEITGKAGTADAAATGATALPGVKAVSELPNLTDALRALPAAAGLDLYAHLHKVQLGHMFEKLVGTPQDNPEEASAMLLRMEQLQRHTYHVAQESGHLVQTRDKLLAEGAAARSAVSATLAPLVRSDLSTLNEATAARLAADASGQLRDVWHMVMAMFLPAGTPGLHPLELDGAIAAVSAAITAAAGQNREPPRVVRDALLRFLNLTA